MLTIDEKKYMQRLGLAIRSKRKQAKIKIKDACAAIEISEREYNRLEGFGRGINPWRLEKLARLFKLKAQDLIDQACVM